MGTRQPTPMTRQAAERIAAAATRDPHRPRPPALDQPLEGGAERLRRPRQRGQEVALSHQLHRSLDTPTATTITSGGNRKPTSAGYSSRQAARRAR
jgi:hypothetical protein